MCSARMGGKGHAHYGPPGIFPDLIGPRVSPLPLPSDTPVRRPAAPVGGAR